MLFSRGSTTIVSNAKKYSYISVWSLNIAVFFLYGWFNCSPQSSQPAPWPFWKLRGCTVEDSRFLQGRSWSPASTDCGRSDCSASQQTKIWCRWSLWPFAPEPCTCRWWQRRQPLYRFRIRFERNLLAAVLAFGVQFLQGCKNIFRTLCQRTVTLHRVAVLA